MVKTFSANIIAPEIRAKMEQAENTSQDISYRELRCPYDGFRVGTVYADTGGHLRAKCQKCRRETIFNLTPGTILDFRKAYN